MSPRKFKSLDSGKAILGRAVIMLVTLALVLLTFFMYDIAMFAMDDTEFSEKTLEVNPVQDISDLQGKTVSQMVSEGIDSYACTVEVDGQTLLFPCELYSDFTVGRILESLNITLGEDDEVNLPLDTVVTPDMHINVSRVTYDLVTEEEVIVAASREIPLVYSVYSGKYKNGTTSKDGIKEVEYRRKLVNGEVVGKTAVSEKVIKKPVNGVKYVDRTDLLDRRSAPANYDYKLRIKFTAYTYTDEGGVVTSTGTKTKVGYVAVDPKLIPYHSLLYIVMDNGFVYGYAYAKDCGGGIKGNRIDIFLPSVPDMEDFGIKMGTCYVVRSGR